MTVKSHEPPQTQTRKPATMAMVAKHAGVSRSAVYAVFSGDSNCNIGVGEEKRERILSAADELGYVANQAARSLASGKTHSIGVLVQSLKTGFYTDLFTTLDDMCYDDGYTLSISTSEFDSEREARHLKRLLLHRVDGLIMAWSAPPQNRELLEQFRSHGIPVLLLDNEDQGLGVPLASFRNNSICELMTSHLYDLGHRRVAFLGACDVINDSKELHQFRMEAFSKAWHERTGTTPQCINVWDTDFGGVAVADMIASMPAQIRPTAVACSTDMLAIGLIQGLRNKGMDVPGDISVMGCDDIPSARQQLVPLSTIGLSTAKLAQEAWRVLGGVLKGEHSLDNHSDVLVAPELIPRDSTCAI